MNTRSYLDIIFKKKIQIVAMTLIVALVALFAAYLIPEKHVVDMSLTVHRVNRETTEDFQYDNYYSVQAAEYVSNTVVGMLASPDVVQEIYTNAQVSDDSSIQSRIKSIKARQKSSHLVTVTVKHADPEVTEKVATAVSDVMSEKVQALESTDENTNSFDVVTGEYIKNSQKVDPLLAFVFGLVCGLFISIALVFLYEYLFLKGSNEEK
ncbi:hypothetical protein KKH43_06070 [Patescibacteria group bacterium]|nr:hypothetical protein [Patescibacteria group bacterium]